MMTYIKEASGELIAILYKINDPFCHPSTLPALRQPPSIKGKTSYDRPRKRWLAN